MIEVKNLSYEIAGRQILNHLSFVIPTNKVVGFLGVNGAGKTSTLDLLSGCANYYDGSILFNGKELRENQQVILQELGYLPDEPPIYEDLLVREYLEYVAGLKGLKKKKYEERYAIVVDQFDLKLVTDKLISALSKGFKQRVALAAVLLNDPKYIFLDEPTEGLDPSQIKKIREMILSLKESRTIFLSSHILSEIENICDHLVIIDEGKIIKQGNINDMRSHAKKTAIYKIRYSGDIDELRSLENRTSYLELISIEDDILQISIEDSEKNLNCLLKEMINKNITICEISISNQNMESMFFDTLREGNLNV